ncbi:MAG TPA: ABC transporter substrate-binding protein [Candidatus Paceibacterota bacterium]
MKEKLISILEKAGELFHSISQSTTITRTKNALSDFVRSNKEKTLTAIRSFSPTEQKIFTAILGVVAISGVSFLFSLNNYFTVEVPAYGGSFSEGVIGAPRFINPALAISDADRDLTALIYSGLMRPTSNGELIPDLAKEYSVSEDGLVYTFHLKEDLVWHDGEPITADDIVFTIGKIQDPVLKSPKRASWEGVATEKVDDHTVIFSLKQAYSPFLENTTLGILPQHIWGQVSSEEFGFSKYNMEPIGSGPYRVSDMKKDSSGIPSRYDLVPFKKFALGKPYISTMYIYFYANETKLLSAFEHGEVDAANAIPPQKASDFANKRSIALHTYVLPRIFGVFFNQNQNAIFTSQAVRMALNSSIDREKIVQDVLFGYGTPIEGPLPPGVLGWKEPLKNKGDESDPIERAISYLEKGGWKVNPETGIRQKKTRAETTLLDFSIVTSEAQELQHTATILQEVWEKLGARVTIKIFNTNDLNQNVIRPRKYDALLFGEIIGRESDPFAFWHSSQRNDPGLNIALYANITADGLLEKGRKTFGTDERSGIYETFQKEIAKDVPAVFVYSPDFLYALPKNIRGVVPGVITIPSERFLDIHNWYIETDNVWKIFNH